MALKPPNNPTSGTPLEIIGGGTVLNVGTIVLSGGTVAGPSPSATITGLQGSIGPTGSIGPQGSIGPTGSVGPAGPPVLLLTDGTHNVTNVATFNVNGGVVSGAAGSGTITVSGTGGGSGLGTLIAGAITSTATLAALPNIPVIAGLPTLGSFVNQNGATLTQATNGPLVLRTLATGAGNSLSMAVKALPAGALTWTANLSYLGATVGSVGPTFGIVLTNGTIAVIATLFLSQTVPLVAVSLFTNPTTFSSNLVVKNVPSPPNPIWFRIVYDGVSTYSFSFSADGVTWSPLVTTAALGLTPTQVGIVINTVNNDSTSGASLSLNYWNGV